MAVTSYKMGNKTYWKYDIRNPNVTDLNKSRIRKKGFATKREAEDAMAIRKSEWFRKKHKLPSNRKTFLSLVDELKNEAKYLRSLVVDHATKHHNFAALTLEKYAEMFPAKMNLLDFKHLHIEQIVEFEQSRGLKPQSVNLYLRYLKSAFRRIKKKQKDVLEDWRIPEGFYIDAPKISRQKFIVNSEIEAILAILINPPREANIMFNTASMWKDAADLMTIGMLTGMRKTEIISLEWQLVQFDLKVLRVKTLKQKNGKELWREIPIFDGLEELLKRRKEKVNAESGGDRFVFPRWQTDKQSQWLYRAVKKACELAKIPYGNRLVDGVIPHATRHTAATKMLLNGTDLKTASEILGHSPETLLKTYAHTTIESKRKAVEGLSLSGHLIH